GVPESGVLSCLGGEELLDQNCGVIRILLGEKVAAVHRFPPHARSPLSPNAEWAIIGCIESVERTTFGPQMQHRTFDSPGRFFVRAIVFHIDSRCSSIFLTDPMNAGGITKS